VTFNRPPFTDSALLHQQIDALGFGNPYLITWADDELSIEFETPLVAAQQAQLEAVVAAHDGSAAIAERAEREAKILAIQDANKALVESAREKRLRGEQMSQQELAALVDLLMFPA